MSDKKNNNLNIQLDESLSKYHTSTITGAQCLPDSVCTHQNNLKTNKMTQGISSLKVNPLTDYDQNTRAPHAVPTLVY